jgi:GNAT superfamily N-acetyltransferase
MKSRQANLTDIPVLVELRKRQLIDEGLSPISNIDKQLAEYFASALSDGSFVSWVMEMDGEIIATSGVCFYSLPPTYADPSGKVAYITNMYTKPEHRRKGIASELLRVLIGEAKKRECKTARLHASALGRPVYEKAGFADSDGYMALKL